MKLVIQENFDVTLVLNYGGSIWSLRDYFVHYCRLC